MPFDLQIGRLDSTLSTSSGHMWLLRWPPGLDIVPPWPRTTYLVCEKFKLRHKTDDDMAFLLELISHRLRIDACYPLWLLWRLMFCAVCAFFFFLFFTFRWLSRLMGKWSTGPTSTAGGVYIGWYDDLVFERKNVWDYWNSFCFLSSWLSEKLFAWYLFSFSEY